MSERPNNNPDGGPEKPRTWSNLVPRIVNGTHKKIVAVVTHPSTVGAAVGTIALPGLGTAIGVVAGPVVHKIISKSE